MHWHYAYAEQICNRMRENNNPLVRFLITSDFNSYDINQTHITCILELKRYILLILVEENKPHNCEVFKDLTIILFLTSLVIKYITFIH